MKEFEFTLLLQTQLHFDELEHILFENGCDDATLFSKQGYAYVMFSRKARTFDEALQTAITNTKTSDYRIRVKSVEPTDLVTSAEIGRRLGRSRQSVKQLQLGERGPGSFPVPLSGLTEKTLIWSWLEIVQWISENNISTKLNIQSEIENASIIRNTNIRLRQIIQDSINPQSYQQAAEPTPP